MNQIEVLKLAATESEKASEPEPKDDQSEQIATFKSQLEKEEKKN